MKLKTPEIVWHDRQPVLSADFHRNGADWRLATAGTDNDVKVDRYHAHQVDILQFVTIHV